MRHRCREMYTFDQEELSVLSHALFQIMAVVIHTIWYIIGWNSAKNDWIKHWSHDTSFAYMNSTCEGFASTAFNQDFSDARSSRHTAEFEQTASNKFFFQSMLEALNHGLPIDRDWIQVPPDWLGKRLQTYGVTSPSRCFKSVHTRPYRQTILSIHRVSSMQWNSL